MWHRVLCASILFCGFHIPLLSFSFFFIHVLTDSYLLELSVRADIYKLIFYFAIVP